MSSIYPTSPSEWAAFIAALVPLVTWAAGGLLGALNQRRERREAEWRRLHELTLVLYNNALSTGLWGQMLAVRELRRLKSRRREAQDVAGLAALFFQNQPMTDGIAVLVEELEQFSNESRSQPRWLVRLRNKLPGQRAK